MAFIEAVIGGKGVGIADQASIEPLKGCDNNCLGCYAKKTTRQGSRFELLQHKEYDENRLRKSLKKLKKNDINVCRMSKHCDPGKEAIRDKVLNILDICTEENVQVVMVAKEHRFSHSMANALKRGKHVLHLSIGMIVGNCGVSDIDRINAFHDYKQTDVNVKIRYIEDVTVKPEYSPFHNTLVSSVEEEDIIITPMRYTSEGILKIYGANKDLYDYEKGYYRPGGLDGYWTTFPHFCGDIAGKEFCCNCCV